MNLYRFFIAIDYWSIANRSHHLCVPAFVPSPGARRRARRSRAVAAPEGGAVGAALALVEQPVHGPVRSLHVLRKCWENCGKRWENWGKSWENWEKDGKTAEKGGRSREKTGKTDGKNCWKHSRKSGTTAEKLKNLGKVGKPRKNWKTTSKTTWTQWEIEKSGRLSKQWEIHLSPSQKCWENERIMRAKTEEISRFHNDILEQLMEIQGTRRI